MQHESDFARYLTTRWKSRLTNKPYNPKVAGDVISRCKRVERELGVELSSRTVGSPAALDGVCESIKRLQISVTDSRPYAYNECTAAVRMYNQFLAWRLGK